MLSYNNGVVIKWINYVKHLEQYVAHSEGYMNIGHSHSCLLV